MQQPLVVARERVRERRAKGIDWGKKMDHWKIIEDKGVKEREKKGTK